MIKSLFKMQIAIVFSIIPFCANSQINCIVADIETHQPIANASVYTSSGKGVVGTFTNEAGRAQLNSEYSSFIFSHISYGQREVNKSEFNDTVFLKPKVVLLNEIKITNPDQKTIRNLLERVLKMKNRSYCTSISDVKYNFNSQAVSDSNVYKFKSTGHILVPLTGDKINHKIITDTNIVVSNDKSAGCDFDQLRRSVYNDLFEDFNKDFLKNSLFIINKEYTDEYNPNIIQVIYRSTNDYKCNGYIKLDTIKNLLVEMNQKADVKFNLKKNTNSLLRAYAGKLGIKCFIWDTDITIKFGVINGNYQIVRCDYQICKKDQYKNKETIKTNFFNVQSVMEFSEPMNKITDESLWMNIPRFHYMGILGKKDAMAEKALREIKFTRIKL